MKDRVMLGWRTFRLWLTERTAKQNFAVSTDAAATTRVLQVCRANGGNLGFIGVQGRAAVQAADEQRADGGQRVQRV